MIRKRSGCVTTERKTNQNNQVISTWIPITYSLVLGISIVIICFFSDWDYAKPLNSLPNLILLPFGLFFIYSLYNLVSEYVKSGSFLNGSSLKYIILLCTLLITILQIIATHKYYFYTDWDVRNVTNAAMEHAQGMPMERWSKYFSKYPNNLLTVFIFSWVIRSFSIFTQEACYFSMIVFQCILYGITGLLTYSVAERISNKRLALLSWIIYFFLVWISPWVTIPYSDSLGLIVPALIFTIYTWNMPSGKIVDLRCFLLGLLTIISYKIKPQTVILMIAIVIVSIVRWIGVDCRNRILEPIKKLANYALGVIIAIVVVEMAISSIGIPIDKEKEIGITSYVMMGLNTESKGVFNEEDRNKSINIATLAERKSTEIQIIKDRIEAMGTIGLLKQAIYKTLTNYNDGTFTWGKEGAFYNDVPESDNSILSQVLRDLYYNRNYMGANHSAWINFAHSIWLSTLFLAFFAIGKREHFSAVLMLSIIGLTCFEILFEARARYFFTYAPIYILLAIQGISVLEQRKSKML